VLPLILLDNKVEFGFVIAPLDMDVFRAALVSFQDVMVHQDEISIVERKVISDESFRFASPGAWNVLVGW
jgi:hypothetical protein